MVEKNYYNQKPWQKKNHKNLKTFPWIEWQNKWTRFVMLSNLDYLEIFKTVTTLYYSETD